jgi:hypothetical protein
MAVITLKRESQTVGFGQRAAPQIFIAHSIISDKLVDEIKVTLKQTQVNPLFAEQIHNQPFSAIIQAMFQSDAMFMVVTKKAFQRKTIRDWILFEFGLARGRWRPRGGGETLQIPVFLWRDTALRLSKEQPLGMVPETKSVQLNSKKSRETMLRDMQVIAQNLSKKSFRL